MRPHQEAGSTWGQNGRKSVHVKRTKKNVYFALYFFFLITEIKQKEIPFTSATFLEVHNFC